LLLETTPNALVLLLSPRHNSFYATEKIRRPLCVIENLNFPRLPSVKIFLPSYATAVSSWLTPLATVPKAHMYYFYMNVHAKICTLVIFYDLWIYLTSHLAQTWYAKKNINQRQYGHFSHMKWLHHINLIKMKLENKFHIFWIFMWFVIEFTSFHKYDKYDMLIKTCKFNYKSQKNPKNMKLVFIASSWWDWYDGANSCDWNDHIALDLYFSLHIMFVPNMMLNKSINHKKLPVCIFWHVCSYKNNTCGLLGTVANGASQKLTAVA